MTPARIPNWCLLVLAASLCVCTAEPPTAGRGQAPADIAELRQASVWRARQELITPSFTQGAYFGRAVALSHDAALIGAYTLSGDGSMTYVYARAGSEFVPVQELAAEPDAAAKSLALSGETAVIGAPGAASDSVGAVSVFTRSASGFAHTQTLTATDGVPGDRFGWAVAISGDTVVVAPLRLGAVYVYTRSTSGWTEHKIVAPGASMAFGSSIAISGNELLVAAHAEDTVYPFTRSGSSWRALPPIARPEPDACGFGVALAIDGGTAIVGADCTAVGEHHSQGAAYVFQRNHSGWGHVQKFWAAEGSAESGFGRAISFSGDTALLGAPNAEVGLHPFQGAATVFVRSGGSFRELTTLSAADGRPEDYFGAAVAVSDGAALVGAPYDGTQDQATQVGSAMIFALVGEDGEPCSTDTECASEHCVDGLCCNEACDGPCDACSVDAGARREGECALVVAGAPGSPSCSAPRSCTGESRECALCTSDAHCPLETYCASNGACTPQKPRGSRCDLAAGADCAGTGCRACESGMCAHGVCCDLSCTGDCQSCVVSGSVGTCTLLETAECVARAVCDEDTLRRADGQTVACEPYRCDERAPVCRTRCSASTDCARGYVCDQHGKCRSSSSDMTPERGSCRIGAGRDSPAHPTLLLLVSALFFCLRRGVRRVVA